MGKRRTLLEVIVLAFLGWVTPVVAQESLSIEQAELRAQVTPMRFALLSAEMNGRIATLNAREGDKVSAGDLLVGFDCGLQNAELSKTRAQLESARNIYRGNQRMAELNAIGQVDLVNSELEVRKASAELEVLNETIKRCEVHAPYSGSIGDLFAREQEFIQAGTQLLEIIDDTQLQLEFIAPSRWINWLTPGLEFDVALDDTAKLYSARLEYTAAKVDAMSQSIKVVARIQGDNLELKPGMSGRVRLVPPQ
ncbi:MAG TPA: efflux RND transporter periplasmic adaptor subunit [Marinobacterium sp.]|nr:efflux RND transporter periplasmic adaptor subunit [Marinobacterium sp.]